MENLFSVTGKVAVVTGGTSGIGLMIARGLVEGGARVYLVARNAEDCKAAAAELSQKGDCRALPGDLATLAGIEEVVKTLGSQENALHLLVNNAGTQHKESLDSYSEEGWDNVVDLNLKSVFFLIQKLLPMLRAGASESSHASVVNMGSSGAMRVGPIENYAYQAAKAGLHFLSCSLGKRLGPEHITVNTIAPGSFPSRLTQANAEVRPQLLAAIPRGRMGEAEDIAGTVIYLASRAGSFTTAAIIPVTGGMHI